VELFNKEEAEGFPSRSLKIEETQALIMQLIEKYPLTTIIIDAMDECDPDKRYKLLEVLEQILRGSSSLVKIFISSRNDQDLVFRLHCYPNLEIDSQRNSDDIARFVKDQTDRLVQDGKLLRHSTSQKEMKKFITIKVTEGAAGM
jgi:hypothetical protein